MSMAEQPANRIKIQRVHMAGRRPNWPNGLGFRGRPSSAIEIQRLVPSVAAALALAAALGCSVEDLFSAKKELSWAWSPPADACRYWHATVGQHTLAYPVEPTAAWVVRHDGIYRDGRFQPGTEKSARWNPRTGVL